MQFCSRAPQAKVFLMYGLTEAFRATYLDPPSSTCGRTRSARPFPTRNPRARKDGTPCEPDEPGELQAARAARVPWATGTPPDKTAERSAPACPCSRAAVPSCRCRRWPSSGAIPCAWTRRVSLFHRSRRRDDQDLGYRVSPTEIEEIVPDESGSRMRGLWNPGPGTGRSHCSRGTCREGEAIDEGRLTAACRRLAPPYMVPARFILEPARLPTRMASSTGPFSASWRERPQHDDPNRKPRHAPIEGFPVIDGMLTIGGVPVERLSARVGATPFYAYDRRLLDERAASLRQAFPESVRFTMMKANPFPALVAHMARLVDGIDVASAGELSFVLDAGAHPREISFAGPGKRLPNCVRLLPPGSWRTSNRLPRSHAWRRSATNSAAWTGRAEGQSRLRAEELGMKMGGGQSPSASMPKRFPRRCRRSRARALGSRAFISLRVPRISGRTQSSKRSQRASSSRCASQKLPRRHFACSISVADSAFHTSWRTASRSRTHRRQAPYPRGGALVQPPRRAHRHRAWLLPRG